MSRVVDKAIVAVLLTAVAFTTLALGTVEAWSVALFEMTVVVLILLWTAKAVFDKRLEIRLSPVALPLGALVLVGIVQSIAFTGKGGQIASLSMDVEATRAATTMIFFLFVAFLVASNFFDSPERLRTLSTFLVIFGLGLAVFALIQHFTWEGKMYWLRPVASAGAGTGGPFVNRNHFAGYMEMLIPIPAATAFSRAARLEERLFCGFCAAIMSVALVASLSRGGLVSLTAGLVFLVVMIGLFRRSASRRESEASSKVTAAVLILLMLAAIAIGIVWIGADLDVVKRVAGEPLTTSLATDRRGIWRDSLTMFQANPILGVGLGAFETVYPIYGHGDGSFVIQFVHNDYLQVLCDAGAVGGAIALWFLVTIARAITKVSSINDPRLRAVGIGSAAGIFALLVHSLFDFNLQIPSNALLFLVLAAVLSNVSGVLVRAGNERHGSRLPEPILANADLV
jgi:O-antigen ligase